MTKIEGINKYASLTTVKSKRTGSLQANLTTLLLLLLGIMFFYAIESFSLAVGAQRSF
jgi:hypothetical protein